MKASKSVRRVLLLTAVMLFLFCLMAPAAFAAEDGGTDIGPGMAYLAAGLSTGVAAIGGGIAVGAGAPAAIGALTEDPKSFGKSLIFVALGEGIALYGMLISILILNKV